MYEPLAETEQPKKDQDRASQSAPVGEPKSVFQEEEETAGGGIILKPTAWNVGK